MRDWVEWHQAYADPASGLSTRLRSVRRHLGRAIDQVAAPVQLVSLCAGQGDDVIGVLAGHPRRDQVTALLVEAEPRNVQAARDRATAAGGGGGGGGGGAAGGGPPRRQPAGVVRRCAAR